VSSILSLVSLYVLIVGVSGVPTNFFEWGGSTQEFFREGVQKIQFRTEDREDGDLGAVAP
jgi:hypothetical protein